MQKSKTDEKDDQCVAQHENDDNSSSRSERNREFAEIGCTSSFVQSFDGKTNSGNFFEEKSRERKLSVRLPSKTEAVAKLFEDECDNMPSHRAKMRRTLLEILRGFRESDFHENFIPLSDLYGYVNNLEKALQTLPKEKILKQFRSIEFNIRDSKNSSLRRAILRHEITPTKLSTMTQSDLANPEIQANRKHVLQERLERADTKNHKVSLGKGFFTCRRCGKRETSFFELQTSRGDESSTKFVTCLVCGLNWKFR